MVVHQLFAIRVPVLHFLHTLRSRRLFILVSHAVLLYLLFSLSIPQYRKHAPPPFLLFHILPIRLMDTVVLPVHTLHCMHLSVEMEQ